MGKLLLILLDRSPLLTESQLDKLSDVFINVGTLFFGSTVVPYFVPGLDKPELKLLILGLAFSLVPWLLAIFSVKRIES